MVLPPQQENNLEVFYKDLFLPLADIMHKHDIHSHIYAADDNLYLAFKPLGISTTYISMEIPHQIFWIGWLWICLVSMISKQILL